jgi:hypothetical protein
MEIRHAGEVLLGAVIGEAALPHTDRGVPAIRSATSPCFSPMRAMTAGSSDSEISRAAVYRSKASALE